MEESYEYEFLDYLRDHPLPERKEDMKDIDYAVKDIVDTLISKLENSISNFYFEIHLFIVCQDDFDSYGICHHVLEADRYYEDICSLLSCWFYENSPLRNYCNIDSTIDKYFNYINDKYCLCDGFNIDKYKKLKFQLEDPILYLMLKEDARTEDAKKYFNERRSE